MPKLVFEERRSDSHWSVAKLVDMVMAIVGLSAGRGMEVMWVQSKLLGKRHNLQRCLKNERILVLSLRIVLYEIACLFTSCKAAHHRNNQAETVSVKSVLVPLALAYY